MKKSIEIQGLPIFSLLDGAEIGKVKQLVIEPSSGSVNLFLVENDQNSIGVYILPFSSVIGVGDFAVTVESGDAIRELSHVEGARDLILLNYKIIGTRVLSRKGRLLGSIEEFYVDADTGLVTACSFAESDNTDSIKVFHRANIMTFGRDVIVIMDEAHVFDSLDQEPASAPLTLVEGNPAAEVAVTSESAPAAAPSPADYLAGKVLSADLFSDSGELLASQGTLITQELIDRVKSAGPTLFMKLNRLAVSQN